MLGFPPPDTLQHELWELMNDLEADEALCFVEMHWSFGCVSALLWFPTVRAAAAALENAHAGGTLPMLGGCPVWMMHLGMLRD